MNKFLGNTLQTTSMYFVIILICIAFGIMTLKISGLYLLLGIILFALIWIRPENATLYVIALIFTNIPAIATQFYSVPKIIAASFSLLLCIPLGVYVFFRHEKLKVDLIMILIILFLTVSTSSSFFAIDKNIAINWVLTLLVEGLVLYFLIVNVIRDIVVMKKVIWVMIFAGSLLGGLSLSQELTHSYRNDFGGLAQRNLEIDNASTGDYGEVNGGFVRQRDDVKKVHRAGGPLGKPNRYAQIMLMVFSIALFQYWSMTTIKRKILATIPLTLILSGILLTYSRGAFVTIFILLVLLTIMRYIKVHQILITIIILIIVISLASPGYMVRMSSIGGIQGLFSSNSAHKPDAVTRGRTTEMLAALMAFVDHPILGVGPGQYSPFYSISYQMDPDIALRHITKARRAHILYFELAAETGIVGFGIFMTIILILIYRLWLVKKRWHKKKPELANIAAGVMFGIFGYLGTAIFLHLSYQRYLWLMLGIAGAVIQISNSQEIKEDNLHQTGSTKQDSSKNLLEVFDKDKATVC